MDHKKSKLKTRILAEIFDSERSYLDDIKFWGVDLKKMILNTSTIPTKKKLDLNTYLFNSLTEIIRLHEGIFREMKMCNLRIAKSQKLKINKIAQKRSNFPFQLDGSQDLSELEYFTIFYNVIESFSCYEGYVKTLPRAMGELDSILKTNTKFADEINQFFEEKSIEITSINNYLTRPTNKIARYPLLIKTVLKYETDPEHKNSWLILRNRINDYVHNLNMIYQNRMQNYNIFNLLENLEYENPFKDAHPLDLIYRNSRILKSNKLVTKVSLDSFATYKQILVFNRYILICSVTDENDEKIKIVRPPLFFTRIYIKKEKLFKKEKDNTTDHLYPIYIADELTSEIVALYFSTVYNRDAYYKELKIFQAIKDKSFDNWNYIIKRRGSSTSDIIAACRINNIPNAYKLKKYKLDKKSKIIKSMDMENDVKLSPEELEVVNNEETSFRSWSNILAIIEHKSVAKDKKKQIIAEEKKKLLDAVAWESSVYRSEMDLVNKEEDDSETYGDIVSDGLDSFQISSHSSNSESIENNRNKLTGGGVFNLLYTEVCGVSFRKKTPVDKNILENTFPKADKSKSINGKFFSTRNGLYLKRGKNVQKVSSISPRKIIYDKKNQLLILLASSTVLIVYFNSETTNLDDRKIVGTAVKDVFFGGIDKCNYLVIIKIGDFNFSLVYLMAIQPSVENDDTTEVILNRKLYVGYKITHISFYKSKIVISAKEFIIVDVVSLKTQPLIEYFDTLTGMYLKILPHKNAVKFFPITDDTYLVCFDRVGFYVDAFGRFKRTYCSFNFECTMVDFVLAEGLLVGISSKYISAFNLSSGKMVLTLKLHDLKFVTQSTKSLKVYTRHEVYRIRIKKKRELATILSNVSRNKSKKSNKKEKSISKKAIDNKDDKLKYKNELKNQSDENYLAGLREQPQTVVEEIVEGDPVNIFPNRSKDKLIQSMINNLSINKNINKERSVEKIVNELIGKENHKKDKKMAVIDLAEYFIGISKVQNRPILFNNTIFLDSEINLERDDNDDDAVKVSEILLHEKGLIENLIEDYSK